MDAAHHERLIFMSNTPNLELPYVLAAQAQKHVVVNEALRKLDALVQISVASRTTTAPPTSPVNGTRYIVPAAATGAWAGKTNQLAVWQDTAWVFFAPAAGWTAWVVADSQQVVYNGTTWKHIVTSSSAQPSRPQTPAPATPAGHRYAAANGATLTLGVVESQVYLSGLRSSILGSRSIPAGSILFGISALVVQRVVGSATWSLGVAANATRFASGLSASVGTKKLVIPSTPVVFNRSEAPMISAVGGGRFSAGYITLGISVMYMTTPSRGSGSTQQ